MRRCLPGVLAIAILHRDLGAQQRDSLTRAQSLDSVVVTAARIATPGRTAAVFVLDGDALRREGYLHLADALRSVPGAVLVQSGSFGGLTSLYLRGGERGYTRVLLDGVPMNDPGGDFDFASLSTSDVERVEIVRGPASTLYGSDAIAGVIQIFTRAGRSRAARLAATAGSFGTSAIEAAVERGSDAHSLAISASRFASSGIYAFNNATRNSAVTLSAGAASASGIEARLLARHTGATTHIPTDGAGAVVDRNAVQDSRRTLLSASLRGNLWKHGSGAVQVSTVRRSASYDDRPDGPSDTLGFYGYRGHDDIDRHGIDASATFAPGVIGRALLGVTLEREAQRSRTHSQSQYGDDDGTLVASRRTRSLYGQVARDGGPGSLLVSGRVDHSDAFGTFHSVRAGGAIQHAGARVRASFGTGFRAPTFFETFATGIARGNPQLKPERTVSAEVGASWQSGRGSFRAAITAFDQRFRDVIQYAYATPSPADPNYYNIAGARSRGVEVESELRLTRGWRLMANATRLNARATRAGFDTSPTSYYHVGEPLLRRPNLVGAAAFTYASAGGSLGVRAHYTGPRDDVDYAAFQRITLPGYTTVDAFARVAVPRRSRGHGAFVRVSVTNLFSARYQAVSGFDAPGRTVLAGLEVSR